VPFVTSMFRANISALLSFLIYFLLCLSSLSVCAILLTVSDFSTYVVNTHLIYMVALVGAFLVALTTVVTTNDLRRDERFILSNSTLQSMLEKTRTTT